MSTLWKLDHTSLQQPTPSSKSRDIVKGPVLNLKEVQSCIKNKTIDPDNDNAFWFATPGSRADMAKYKWTVSEVADMICLLNSGKKPKGDYKKSEWCRVDGGEWYPCDVYTFNYDEYRKERNNSNGQEIYLKFSVDKDGTLAMTMVSNHFSR